MQNRYVILLSSIREQPFQTTIQFTKSTGQPFQITLQELKLIGPSFQIKHFTLSVKLANLS